MLSVNEVKRVGRYRFWNTGIWKHFDWFTGVSFAWFIIIMVIATVYIINSAPDNSVAYIIPASIVEEGKDISIVSEKGTGYTVNGYLLKHNDSKSDRSSVSWLLLVIALIPLVGSGIMGTVGENKADQYADYTAQKWVDTKEL